jgi:hypothetical protein
MNAAARVMAINRTIGCDDRANARGTVATSDARCQPIDYKKIAERLSRSTSSITLADRWCENRDQWEGAA